MTNQLTVEDNKKALDRLKQIKFSVKRILKSEAQTTTTSILRRLIVATNNEVATKYIEELLLIAYFQGVKNGRTQIKNEITKL